MANVNLFSNQTRKTVGMTFGSGTSTTGGEALKGLDSVDRPDHCLIWTFCGIPAISLPVFVGPNKLPFGAQIVSRRYNDYLLLSFGEELSKIDLTPEPTFPQLAN